MSWPASFGVALLAAVAGCVGAGFVANLGVSWYRITSREGASGYFVVGMGLVGFLAGFVLGLVTARVLAGGAHRGFFEGLGAALAVELALLAAIAGVSRALADVPPTANGERLWLQVEVRVPDAGAPFEPVRLEMGSLSFRTLRARRDGVLFPEDARRENGFRVVPGVAPLFTTRGTPTFSVAPADEKTAQGFVLGSWPAAPSDWSDWLPRARPDGKPPATPFAYRYRVVPASEPIREARLGGFTVGTVLRDVYLGGNPPTPRARAEFRLAYAGAPVALDGEPVDELTAMPGPRPALLVHQGSYGGSGPYTLLLDDGGSLRRVAVAEMKPRGGLAPLTNDAALFASAQRRGDGAGWFDPRPPGPDGAWLVGDDALLDTRTGAVRRFRLSPDLTPVPSLPPLGISPDGRSIVRFGWRHGMESEPVLAAIDTMSGRNDLVPIDRARMRFAKLEQIDPAWVAHHFEWVRRDDGVDRLAPRATFTPLPYHGEMQSHGKDRPVYWIDGAGEPVRAALLDFLRREFRAEALPAEDDAYEKPVRIDGEVVNVAHGASPAYVCVSPPYGAKDSGLVRRIGERFDAELATGRLDALFAAGE